MPAVKDRSFGLSVRPAHSQAKPTSVISGPVRLSGRRFQATRPATTNDQATKQPTMMNVQPFSRTCELTAPQPVITVITAQAATIAARSLGSVIRGARTTRRRTARPWG